MMTRIMAYPLTRQLWRQALLALALLAPGLAQAAESAAVTSPRVTATLLSSRDAVAPGERFQVALVQKIAPGWHTYWANPGDSGEPTRIAWTLSQGATAGEIQWPAPKAIPVEPLVNFGFEGTVLLPVEIAVPPEAKIGERLTLQAAATWLVCEKICIPEEGTLTLDLPVAPAAIVAEAAQSRIEAARAALPAPAGFRGRLAAEGEALALTLPGLPAAATELRVFPLSDTLIDHAAAQEVRTSDGATVVRLARSSAFKIAAGEIAGVLTYREGGLSRALTFAADVEPALVGAASAPAAPPATVRIPLPAEGADLTLWAALLFAFAGGLILNLMPCVLPVLFIKALGFAQLAQASRVAGPRAGAALPLRRPSHLHGAGGDGDCARRARHQRRLGLPAAVTAAGHRARRGDDADRPQPAGRLRDRNLGGRRRPWPRQPGRATGGLHDRRSGGGRRDALHGALHGRGHRLCGHAAAAARPVRLPVAGAGFRAAGRGVVLRAGPAAPSAEARPLDADPEAGLRLPDVRHRDLADLGRLGPGRAGRRSGGARRGAGGGLRRLAGRCHARQRPRPARLFAGGGSGGVRGRLVRGAERRAGGGTGARGRHPGLVARAGRGAAG
ncbi:MAG: hypothetical protein C0420_05470 [Methylobacterium sp.]|nr:hypothetical protein [Methylobacterium sp.]